MPDQRATAVTIGMFDGVHLGHQTLLAEVMRQAAMHGIEPLVVTFDRHPQVVLRPAVPEGFGLIMPLDCRVQHIRAMGVEQVQVMHFTRELAAHTARQFMQLLRDRHGMRVLVMGYDHHFGHDRCTVAQCQQIGSELGIDVVKAPEYLGEFAPVSSSIVRRLLQSGKVDDAARCMGRPYSLAGDVVHGFHNGRGIGFPTANMGNLDPDVLLPHHGAYAVLVHVGGQVLQGMVNIGNRPTLHNGEKVSVEVNIFDFDDDIYGKPIALEFIKFLRLEFKLGSIAELRAQLTRDRDKSRRILTHWQLQNPG